MAVTGLPHERHAAVGADVLLEGARGLDVEEDPGARRTLQLLPREHRGQLVAADEPSGRVDGTDPVAVSVEPDSHLRSDLDDALAEVDDVRVDGRVRMVVGKRAVDLVVEAVDAGPYPLEQKAGEQSAAGVGGIEHESDLAGQSHL